MGFSDARVGYGDAEPNGAQGFIPGDTTRDEMGVREEKGGLGYGDT